MGLFKNITNFLSKPAVRVGTSLVGAAAAGGAFEGMGNIGESYGGGISAETLAGLANVASAGSSMYKEGINAGNVAQMGLGGYNIGQRNFLAGTGYETVPKAFSTISGAFGAPDTGQSVIQGPSATRQGTPAPFNDGAIVSAPLPDVGAPAGEYEASRLTLDNMMDEELNLRAGGATPAPTPFQVGKASGTPTTVTDMAGTTTTLPTLSTTQTAQAAGEELPWTERLWEGLKTSVAKDPMKALGAAMTVPSMFTPSVSDEAMDMYRQAMNDANARASLSSPEAQAWMSNYMTTSEAALQRQYEEARGSYIAEMTNRGMRDSSVFNDGLARLEGEYMQKKAELPMTAQVNWLQAAAQQATAVRGYAAPGTAVAGAMLGQPDTLTQSAAALGAVGQQATG